MRLQVLLNASGRAYAQTDQTSGGMKMAKMQAGAFLHSFLEASLEASIRAAGKSGLGLGVAQIGPVDNNVLGGKGYKAAREGIVQLLNEEELKIALGCACFEPGQLRTGGVEDYTTIEHIAKSGGLGYIKPHKTKILKQRMEVYKNHIRFLVYLRDQGLISQDKTCLSSHWGFIDRSSAQRKQVKEGLTEIAKYAKARNVYILLETGTEPIEHTIDFIREIKLTNIGLNLDFANHILYRTQTPEGVLKGLEDRNFYEGELQLHAKDAVLNKGAQIIGRAEGNWQAADVPLGTGIVPWKELIIPTLYKKGYRGAAIIEREAQKVDPGLMTAAAGQPEAERRLNAAARLVDIRTAMNYLLEMTQYVTR